MSERPDASRLTRLKKIRLSKHHVTAAHVSRKHSASFREAAGLLFIILVVGYWLFHEVREAWRARRASAFDRYSFRPHSADETGALEQDFDIRKHEIERFGRSDPQPDRYEREYVISDGEYEHRKVSARRLGWRLLRNEVVHHINGIKSDNRLENLCVLDRYAHDRFHGWLRWKKEQRGKYPHPNYQKAVLRNRFRAILFSAD